MSLIEKDQQMLTLVNVFSVEPYDQRALIRVLTDATEVCMQHLPGFVSAAIHRSLDGRRVVNYARWESKAAFEAMQGNPQAAPHMKAAAALATFEPILCESPEAIGKLAHPSAAADEDEAKLQIRALVREWMTATRQGDTEKILGLMTDDALFLVPGKAPMDKAMFEKQARAQTSADGPAIDGHSDIEEIVVCGDWAFARSHLQVTMTPRSGAPPSTRSGYTMTVFRRQGNKWLLARDANLLAAPSA